MDVRQLRYFVSVIDLRSFSRAAEVLHVAQPALGLQIRKLEDELHTQLLVRHSRGVEPTAAGNLLRERALAILTAMEEAKQAIRDFSGPPRGVVKLGTTPSTHPLIPIELIKRSEAELPNLRIEIKEAMMLMLLDMVRAQEVDFGIVYCGGNRPADLLFEDLAQERAVFVQSQPARPAPPTIGLAEVCQHPLVMPGQPHDLRALVQASAEREGLEPEFTYEIGGVGTILAMVERNIACSVLPFGAVARHVRDGRIVARTIVDPELRLTVSLVRSPRRALSKGEVQLRALLEQIVGEERQPAAPFARELARD